jgi:hypothetical protein
MNNPSREFQDRAIDALGGGVVVLEGPANHRRGWEAAGGWLALSPEWLAFCPHRINRQVGRLLIPVAAIRGVRPCWTRLFGVLPLWPNSIEVETTSGRSYRFVLRRRWRWLAALRCLGA